MPLLQCQLQLPSAPIVMGHGRWSGKMENTKPSWQFDWKQVGDYLLGRSVLIGIASLMLLLISGYATWHGMRDFIIGVSGPAGQDSASGLSVPNDLLVAVVVVALTFLM